MLLEDRFDNALEEAFADETPEAERCSEEERSEEEREDFPFESFGPDPLLSCFCGVGAPAKVVPPPSEPLLPPRAGLGGLTGVSLGDDVFRGDPSRSARDGLPRREGVSIGFVGVE